MKNTNSRQLTANKTAPNELQLGHPSANAAP
jgi:hypothetical protein